MKQPLTTTQRAFTTSDGVKLSYYTWSREPLATSSVLILVLHGIGFHAKPYMVAAENIGVAGATFAALDFRGHGGSGGIRGELVSPQRMVDDIAEWVAHMRATLQASATFLIAESMAGPYGFLYAIQNPQMLNGLVAVAPAVLASWRQALHPNSLKASMMLLGNASSPVIELGGSRLRSGSRDSRFVFERSEDTIALQTISPKYVLRIGEAIGKLMTQGSLSTQAPVLILHGNRDNILSPWGSRLLHHRLRSPDKSLVILPGAYHTLLWDDTSPTVFNIIGSWISMRLPLHVSDKQN